MPICLKSQKKKRLICQCSTQLALKSMLEDETSIRAVTKKLGVPKSTLSNHVKRLKMGGLTSMSKLSIKAKQAA